MRLPQQFSIRFHVILVSMHVDVFTIKVSGISIATCLPILSTLHECSWISLLALGVPLKRLWSLSFHLVLRHYTGGPTLLAHSHLPLDATFYERLAIIL
eukprot:scaffold72590_cov68-Cyclotella_meneghiniana.AAC.2